MRVKSINCTGFSREKNQTFHVNSASELIHSHWFFEKKTVHVNSVTVEPCSTVVVPPSREATKPAALSLFLVDPNTIKLLFFNQTVLYMAAGEPHP